MSISLARVPLQSYLLKIDECRWCLHHPILENIGFHFTQVGDLDYLPGSLPNITRLNFLQPLETPELVQNGFFTDTEELSRSLQLD